MQPWLAFLWDCLKGRDRFVDLNPRQFIFEEDRLLWGKWCRIVEGCNREIDRVRVLAVFEKQMSAATRGKRTNPIRARNLARFALCHDQILARHRSPLHIRPTGASPAIDAMTIDQSKRSTLQQVSCPAANASTSEFHKVRLADSNHELTRMNQPKANRLYFNSRYKNNSRARNAAGCVVI